MVISKFWRKLRIFTLWTLGLLALLHPGRFSAWHYEVIGPNDVMRPHVKPQFCDTNITQLERIDVRELTIRQSVAHGGIWFPDDCVPRFQSNIIVPYRQRESHLKTFLSFIHPFLQAQNISYTITVVEQADEKPFNRAKLFNVGFTEVTKSNNETNCFIFHDVDLLPEDARNIYTCSDKPRHMTTNLDQFRYNLPYSDLFGGAVAISDETFRKVNGFSNKFFGWGGEDDDMSKRLRRSGFTITRFSPIISRYRTLTHEQADKNHGNEDKLQDDIEFHLDGLSDLAYELISLEKFPHFTLLKVRL